MEDFLLKVQDLQKKKKGATLKDFVDKDLSDLYKEILVSAEVDVPKMDTTLKKLDNPALNNLLTLNYYFDHIYLLNLDRRPDRLDAMSKDFKRNHLFNWSKWTALDGKQSPHYEEWQNYRKQRLTMKERLLYQRKAIGSAGSWAILKSMYNMIKDAMENKYKTILVFQDDLLFHKNFIQEFLKLPETVPSNWKLLYLGATQHNWSQVEMRNKYYFPMGTADGAYAVAIHHSIFQEILDEIVKFDMPFDSGTLKTIQKRYGRQCIIMHPHLVIADIRDSDLRNSRDLQMFSSKFKWNLGLYHIPT